MSISAVYLLKELLRVKIVEVDECLERLVNEKCNSKKGASEN